VRGVEVSLVRKILVAGDYLVGGDFPRPAIPSLTNIVRLIAPSCAGCFRNFSGSAIQLCFAANARISPNMRWRVLWRAIRKPLKHDPRHGRPLAGRAVSVRGALRARGISPTVCGYTDASLRTWP
jgi:hypothetical protein